MTTSTVVAFRANLIAALQATTDVQVADGWQGPETQDEGIYLTDLRFSNELIAFKQARQPRVETYEQTVVIQAWRAAETPTEHDQSVARVFALFAALEDVVASDDDIAGELVVQVLSGELTTVPFETGWAARLAVLVSVSADLV